MSGSSKQLEVNPMKKGTSFLLGAGRWGIRDAFGTRLLSDWFTCMEEHTPKLPIWTKIIFKVCLWIPARELSCLSPAFRTERQSKCLQWPRRIRRMRKELQAAARCSAHPHPALAASSHLTHTAPHRRHLLEIIISLDNQWNVKQNASVATSERKI